MQEGIKKSKSFCDFCHFCHEVAKVNNEEKKLITSASLKCNRVYCSYKFLKEGLEGGLKIFMGG